MSQPDFSLKELRQGTVVAAAAYSLAHPELVTDIPPLNLPDLLRLVALAGLPARQAAAHSPAFLDYSWLRMAVDEAVAAPALLRATSGLIPLEVLPPGAALLAGHPGLALAVTTALDFLTPRLPTANAPRLSLYLELGTLHADLGAWQLAPPADFKAALSLWVANRAFDIVPSYRGPLPQQVWTNVARLQAGLATHLTAALGPPPKE